MQFAATVRASFRSNSKADIFWQVEKSNYKNGFFESTRVCHEVTLGTELPFIILLSFAGMFVLKIQMCNVGDLHRIGTLLGTCHVWFSCILTQTLYLLSF